MIAFIRGKIILKFDNRLVLEVNNIGYEVFLSERVIGELSLDSEAELYIYHHVREDASNLYGFSSVADWELFELLIGVSGIGPKTALNVLNIASALEISQAILRDDPYLLTKVAGIGKKTAERIVLELKNKILPKTSKGGELESSNLAYASDEIDALIALGYNLSEARTALSKVPTDISDSAERVKSALRLIRKS